MTNNRTYWATYRNYYMEQARRSHLASNRTYFVKAARDCNRRMLHNAEPAVTPV